MEGGGKLLSYLPTDICLNSLNRKGKGETLITLLGREEEAATVLPGTLA